MIIMRLEDLALEENVNHIATDWQISEFKDFSVITEEVLNDSENKTSIIIQKSLDPTKTWYGRARCLLTSGYTVWGNLEVFTTEQKDSLEALSDLPSRISVPQITTTSKQENHDVTMFEIQASGFETVGNSTHFATSWIIEDINGNTKWASLENSIYKLSIPVQDIILDSNSAYRIKVIFHSSSNDMSPTGTYTIRTGDSSDVHLLTYIDDVDITQPLALEMNALENVSEVTWRIYGFVNDIAYNAWEDVLGNNNYTKTTVPVNTLKENSVYVLEIVPTSTVINSKFIPFRTKYKGGTIVEDTTPTVTFKPAEYSVKLDPNTEYTIPFESDADELQLTLDNPTSCSISRVNNSLVIKSFNNQTDITTKLYITAYKEGYKTLESIISINLVSAETKLLPIVSFTVDPYIITLSNAAKEMTFSCDIPTGATVKCDSYDSNLITVNQTSTNTFQVVGNKNKITGSCVLTIICEKDGYNSNSKNVQVNIPDTLIYEVKFTVSSEAVSLTNAAKEVDVTVTKPSEATFSVVSNDSSLFSVSKLTNTTFKISGNKTLTTGSNFATVTCSQPGYDNATKKISVSIPNPLAWPVEFSLNPSSVTLNNSLMETTVTVTKPTNAIFTVTSNDEKLCTVTKLTDTTFKITGNKTLTTGNTTISVTCSQSGYSNNTITLPVSIPSALAWPVEFTVSPTSMTLTNDSKSTTISVTAPTGATVTATSSDATLFTVTKQSNSVINVVGNRDLKTGSGKVTISVSKSGYTTSSKTVDVSIPTALAYPVEFSLSTTTVTLTNAAKEVTVTVTKPTGATFTVVSNNTALATVTKLTDTTFKVTGNKTLKTGTGTVTVTCSQTGYSNSSKSANVVINSALAWPVQNVNVSKTAVTLTTSNREETLTVTKPTGSAFTVASSNTNAATVTKLTDTTFKITGNKTGTTGSATITVSFTQTGYTAVSKTVTATISSKILWPITFSISPTSLTLKPQASSTITVTNPDGATITAKAADTTLVTVTKVSNTSFTVTANTANKSGTTNITFTATKTNYSTATKTLSTTVSATGYYQVIAHANLVDDYAYNTSETRTNLGTPRRVAEEIGIGFGITDSNCDGLSQDGTAVGALVNQTLGYIKYAYNGKICYTPLKPICTAIAWNDLAKREAVYGVRTIRLGTLLYNVRLMKEAEYKDLFTKLTNGTYASYKTTDLGLENKQWIEDFQEGAVRKVMTGTGTTSTLSPKSRTGAWRFVLEYIPEELAPYNNLTVNFPNVHTANNEKFVYDRYSDTGYFGTATVIDGNTLNTQLGVTSGTVLYRDSNWFKFYWHGQIVFIIQKPSRCWLNYNDIATHNCHHGTDMGGNGKKTITIGSCTYRAMNILGGSESPHSKTNVGGTGNYGTYSQWNELMYRISATNPDGQVGSNWETFSEYDTNTSWVKGEFYVHYSLESYNLGCCSWCREVGNSSTLHRGNFGVGGWNGHNALSYSNTGIAFRCLLSLPTNYNTRS